MRTVDKQGMGKVIAVPDNDDSIIISQGANDIYNVPRSMISEFNGAEVRLNITADSLVSLRVEDASAYEAQPSYK